MDKLGALGSAARYVLPAAGVIVLSSGCSLMVNPFRDELTSQAAVSTPSADGVRDAKCGEPSELVRPFEEVQLAAADGTLTHGPLYFEDSFEDTGSDDGNFAWTGEDYRHPFYWRGRFLLNAIFFPVSVVVTPPWTVMASDGHPSRECLGLSYDSRRWTAENPQ